MSCIYFQIVLGKAPQKTLGGEKVEQKEKNAPKIEDFDHLYKIMDESLNDLFMSSNKETKKVNAQKTYCAAKQLLEILNKSRFNRSEIVRNEEN